MASVTTSGPMPSPPMTASLMLCATTAVPYFPVAATWQECPWPHRRSDSVKINHPGEAGPDGASDVDLLATEHLADGPDDAWTVGVPEEDHVVRRRQFGVQAVDLDEVLGVAESRQGAADRHQLTVRRGATHRQQVPPVVAHLVRHETHLHAAFLGHKWRVDVGNRLLGDVAEESLHNRQP